jgi:DNA mismatch endonuclease (patch repair protein)
MFVDGCFWHGCPTHYRAPITNVKFWRSKIERNMARDRAVGEALLQQGWTVIRIWEHSVRDDLDQVLHSLLSARDTGRT